MKNIIKFIQSSNRPFILSLIILKQFLGIPAVIFHELSHLFFIVLTGTWFEFDRKSFEFFKVNEDFTEMKTYCIEFNFSTNSEIITILVSIAPHIFLLLYIMASFCISMKFIVWGLSLLLYGLLVLNDFLMSDIDCQTFKKSWNNLVKKFVTKS